jgi:hypothetical protein
MGLITGTRRGKASRSKSMARRPRGHEKIKMDKKRHGYFPQRFTWRGRRYDVQAVERCWTVSRKRLGNRVERLCFRVRCAAVGGQGSRSGRAILEGTFELYQDLNSESWHLEKVVSRT